MNGGEALDYLRQQVALLFSWARLSLDGKLRLGCGLVAGAVAHLHPVAVAAAGHQASCHYAHELDLEGMR